jgi:hypothetical protein
MNHFKGLDMNSLKATNSQIVAAYRETGSVWAAGKLLGMAGQTIHERLRSIGHPMVSQKWTSEELAELGAIAGDCTIGEIANRLGRPYAGVAAKISRLGLGVRYGNRRQRRAPSGYDKKRVRKLIDRLERSSLSLRRFCRKNSLDLETFIAAMQRVDPRYWDNYTKRVSDLSPKVCGNCQKQFYPLTKKARSCSRRCADHARRDKAYFGGKRNTAIGLREGICQLCMETKSVLAAHHLLGKQNDPENDYLIALCNGCHHLVSILSGRNFIDHEQGWENLINLALARRLADRNRQNKTDFMGTHVAVDIEWLTQGELEAAS